MIAAPSRIRSAYQRRPLVGLKPAVAATALICAAIMGNAQAQSLVDLYKAAKLNDTTMRSAQAQLQASTAKSEQAQAGLRPQAGLSAGANWAQVDSSLYANAKSVNNQAVSLSASHPLYRPVNRFNSEQGQLGVDVAQAQLDAVEQDLIVRTAQAYFDVVAAQDSLTFVLAQKKAVAEQLAAAKTNFEVGTTTITDSREAQARFDLVTAQEFAAANDLRVKRLALDQLTGTTDASPKPLATKTSLPSVATTGAQEWVSQALRLHPSVRQLDKARDIAEVEVKKAQAGNKPTLDLVGQYQINRAPSNSSAVVGNVRTNTASLGVQFNMPLFSGYAIENRVKETLALVDKANADRETALRSLSQSVRSAYYGVLSGESQVKALEAAEASSQSALDANKLGYQVGVRINIDVLNAQSQLFQTKRDLAQARYNVLVGQLRLKQAAGALKAEDLNAVNALLAP